MKHQTISMAFSHVGLHVFDLEKMADFYQRILGLLVTDRGKLPGRELVFMSADVNEHHQVVLATGRTGSLDDKVVNQISFRLKSLEDLQTVYRSLLADGEATDFRAVNHGNAWTLYFRDPEKNRIELFVDSPWYVAQPRADDLDLNLPVDELYALTEKMCKADPSYMTRAQWQAGFRKRFTAQ